MSLSDSGSGVGLALLYAALLVVLIVTSTPRHSGDAAEYLGMSNNLRQLRAPALNEAELAEARALFQKWGSGYDTPGAFQAIPELRGDDGRQDFLHFWFYPLLAAPGLALTDALGRHPTYAFALTNLFTAGHCRGGSCPPAPLGGRGSPLRRANRLVGGQGPN